MEQKEAAAAAAAVAAPTKSKKKGIASKKNEPQTDDVEEAAKMALSGAIMDNDAFDDFGDFGFDLDEDMM